MAASTNRRVFLKKAGAAGLGLSIAGRLSTARGRGAPSEKIIVAVMGGNNRGNALARTFAHTEGASSLEEVGLVNDLSHVQNFLECIRTGERPHSYIEGGHKSTLMCHLGNISHRTGRALACDPSNGHIIGDEEAMRLWSRAYAPGWEPTV